MVTKLTSALAPGSYLQLTHFCAAAPAAAALERVLMRSIGSGRMRSRAEIAGFFDGLELVESRGRVPARVATRPAGQLSA